MGKIKYITSTGGIHFAGRKGRMRFEVPHIHKITHGNFLPFIYREIIKNGSDQPYAFQEHFY